MSEDTGYKLVFEGPADESAETLRKLRTSLLADAGLSVMEAQEILSNAPKTVKTAEVEEDLKPLYAAIKKAGGKVLIVRPVQEEIVEEAELVIEAPNEKAYFLDLEHSGLDDDLLKSLEALPGEEERSEEAGGHALDLTDLPNDIVIPDKVEKPEPEPIQLRETPPGAIDPKHLSDPPKAEEKKETLAPPANAPLFEFDDGEAQPVQAAATPTPQVEAPKDIESAPLFDFGPPATEPAPITPSSGTGLRKEAKPLEPDDLSLSFEDPAPEPPTHSGPAHAAKAGKSATEDEDLLAEDLSQSLGAQIASEVAHSAPKKESAPLPSSLKLDAEEAPPAAAPVQPVDSSPAVPSFAEIVAQEAPVPTPPPVAPRAPEPAPEPIRFSERIERSWLPVDLLLPILIGALILGAANWAYFRPALEGTGLLNVSIPKSTDKDSDEANVRIISTEEHLKLKSERPDYSMTTDFVFDEGQLKKVSVEAVTPQPPELTPQQIVRGERPQVWLRKIELSSFVFEKQLDGSWKATGPARVFLEQGTVKRRLVGQAKVIVFSYTAPNKVKAHISILRSATEEVVGNGFQFEPLPGGDIHLSLQADISQE